MRTCNLLYHLLGGHIVHSATTTPFGPRDHLAEFTRMVPLVPKQEPEMISLWFRLLLPNRYFLPCLNDPLNVGGVEGAGSNPFVEQKLCISMAA